MLFLKLFFSLFDIGNIVLVYLLSKRNARVAFLYAVNPATIFTAAAHGQLESIPIFFILLALYLHQRQKNSVVTSVVLGFAILAKVWPLLLLPFFIKYSKKWYLYILSLVIPVASIVIYAKFFHTSFLEILRPSLSYRGAYGAWGISILTHFIFPQDVGFNNAVYKTITNITIIILLVLTLLRKKTSLFQESFIFILLFSAFVLSGANPLWLLPLILLCCPKYWEVWWMLVNILTCFSVAHEVANTVNIALEQVFINASLVTAFILWLVNLQIIYFYFRIFQRSNDNFTIFINMIKHYFNSQNRS